MKRELTEREKWLIERIGKRVFRNKTTCPCAVCERVYQEGLVIADEGHAVYLSDIEAAYTHDGFPLRYFDTREEALEFEKLNREQGAEVCDATDVK